MLTDWSLFLALIIESGDMIWEIQRGRKMFHTRKPWDLETNGSSEQRPFRTFQERIWDKISVLHWNCGMSQYGRVPRSGQLTRQAATGSGLNKMRSRLIAQICHFFRLMAQNSDFCDKKCRILTFCDKTESYFNVLQQNSSLWLSLSLSWFAHKGLAWFTRPLLGS